MKKISLLFSLVLFFCGSLTSCLSTSEVKQFGIENEKTFALNLTKDPNVGTIYVTHVNGEATGAVYREEIIPGFGGTSVYVNPLYIPLNGKPVIFTISCPVIVGRNSVGDYVVKYKSTELRLTKLQDIKPGDVLTLKWMYQTQTFVFMDATGNIIQQTIPQFN